MMTGEQLKQALANLAEYAGDPDAIAGYWASINGKAMMLGISRKGLSSEKAKLDAVMSTAPKLTPAE